MDGVQQLDQIAPMLGEIVGHLSDADLGRPTPCAKFDVAGVLEHMIAGASAFAPGFRGDGSAPNPPTDGDVFARWNEALGALMEAVHTEGAPDNKISSPFGEVTGAYFARYVALDGITHAWDLATATGQTVTPPDELVAEIDAFARDLLQPDMRDGDTFAAATEPPADATPLERLVAFTGRTVPR
jgi:uncharacterized protein (TIGR03086 family)